MTFLETAAHIKLSRGNLTQSFCFGGYGYNSPIAANSRAGRSSAASQADRDIRTIMTADLSQQLEQAVTRLVLVAERAGRSTMLTRGHALSLH